MADYSGWLGELAKRTGASVDQDDIRKLASTNDDDVGRVQRALEAQYQRRGSSGQEGSGMDTYGAAKAGYGSSRNELAEEGGSGGGNAAQQSWGGGGGGNGGGSGSSQPQSVTINNTLPDWYKGMMEEQLARQKAAEAETRARGDALYGRLSTQADQGLAVDRNDPVIRQQADANSANLIRSERSFISDLAERSGPYANLTGQRRIAAEHTGQASGGFEASLIGGEVAARRQAIMQALSGMQGMLTSDQSANLQLKLGSMDQAIKQAGVGLQQQGLGLQARGQDQSYDLGLKSNDLGLRNLGLNNWDRNMYWDLLQRGAI